MDSEVIRKLCKIYDRSELPVRIDYPKGSFENRAFKEMFKGKAMLRDELVSMVKCKRGQCYEVVGDNVVYVNVIKTNDLRITELLSEEPLEAAFCHPSIARYLTCFFSRLHSDVESIYENSREIRSNIREETVREVEAAFNTIHNNLNDIIRYIIDPEQIFALLDDNCTISSFCVNDAVTDLAKQLTESCGVETKTAFKGKCYATVNKNAFNVVIADIAEDLCRSRPMPKCVEFSANKEGGKTRIRIEVKYSGNPTMNEDGKNPADLYFYEYVRKLFCEKFGAKITFENEFTADITVPEALADRIRVEAKICFEELKSAFSAMRVRGANPFRRSDIK